MPPDDADTGSPTEGKILAPRNHYGLKIQAGPFRLSLTPEQRYQTM